MNRSLHLASSACYVSLAGLLWAGPLRAAELSLCPSEGAAAATDTYGPDGRLLRLSVGDAPAASDACHTLALPVPARAVRWLALSDIPPAAGAPDRLALQGFFDADEVRISEVIHALADIPDLPGFMPFNVDMRTNLVARQFGVEERARRVGEQLQCSAGTRSAGEVLGSALQWEQVEGLALEVAASGRGEFGIALEDEARTLAESPLEIGRLRLDETGTTVRYLLPGNAQRWSRLVILCPSDEAMLTLHSLRLVTPPQAGPAKGRATWLWTPMLWQQRVDAIWQLAEREHLNKVYITVPVGADGAIEQEATLAAFIGAAAARGIAVWAVAGDRSDVLPENLPIIVARADAYRRFNAAHPEAPLAGLQLDIEPYLLPGSALAPDYWRTRYLATVSAVHQVLAGRLPLDLAVPVWWGLHRHWGPRLLDGLVLPDLSLTVMNYRTDRDALRSGAMPFLAWGRRHGREVSMALEKGRVGVNARNGRDETRISFAQATSGELWLLELAGVYALVLLDGEYDGLPGTAFVRTDVRGISTSTISFADAGERLSAVASQMEAEWSVWDSFAGLAIHGLDQDMKD